MKVYNSVPINKYNTKDYLGNNRTVVNGSTGKIEQSVAYYPFGGVIADLGFGHGEQQYKFGGKELDMANGLNEYDFEARRYYQGVPMFTQPDPKAEKYYWISPYVYCGNNPVNLIDPDGDEPTMVEAALMCDYVYGDKNRDIKLGSWKVSQKTIEGVNFMNDKTGFKSMLFERTVKGVTEYAYAFAGTDGTDSKDWENNVKQVYGSSDQYKQAIRNAKLIKKNVREEVTFIGHSLGGGMAAAAAYATNGRAITFNPAGVSSLTINNNNDANIDTYINVRDELNILQTILPLPKANGRKHFMFKKSELMGHDIKNFYAPSPWERIKQTTINMMSQLESYFTYPNLFPY